MKCDAARIDDMHKEKLRLRIAGSIFVAILFICATGVLAAVKLSPPGQARADILHIDTLKAFGRLERGAVNFFHDKHTVALEKAGKDCSVCHLKETGADRLSIKFKRLVETDKKSVMDLYHANCITCHDQMMGAKQKTGPVVCAGCHAKESHAESSRQPMGLNNSLHFRHEKALEKKCEKCHHVFDEKTKKLVYAKGQEGSCRYCHKEMTEENRISMRLASHKACVDCHQQTVAQNKKTGPLQCAGCHDADQQKKIETVADLPRMEMKQPDAVFVKTGLKEGDDMAVVRMKQVPFNHKSHETRNDSCRVCHHASLTACSECHTLAGKKEGKGVKLEQSMHLGGTTSSCIGCHSAKQAEPQCAGCHALMSPVRKASDETCKACHMPSTLENAALPKDPKDAAELADKMLAGRKPTVATLDEKDIPEIVTIKALADKYKSVEMPHRKIVQKLADNIKDNRLANYFHTDPATLCQGCHHNSPLAKKPPQCGSCHGLPFDDRNPFRPGLMAAYHQQCMGCHDEMGIQKPDNRDCIACHKEK
jgi:hypothetical protein